MLPPQKKHFIPLYLSLSLNPQWAPASIRVPFPNPTPRKSRECEETSFVSSKEATLSSGLKKHSLCTERDPKST